MEQQEQQEQPCASEQRQEAPPEPQQPPANDPSNHPSPFDTNLPFLPLSAPRSQPHPENHPQRRLQPTTFRRHRSRRGRPSSSPASRRQVLRRRLTSPLTDWLNSPPPVQRHRNAVNLGRPYSLSRPQLARIGKYHHSNMSHSAQVRGSTDIHRRLDPQVSHGPSSTPEARRLQLICSGCNDNFDVDVFPYFCKKCTDHYCRDCLKSYFLDASKDESMMPPKCCTAIPVASVADLLTPSEFDLFRAKYEEWATPNRLYCPVPHCSQFISPRLYVKPTLTGKVAEKHVSCPKCSTSICTQCRSLAHIDDCPKSDLDPTLEEIFKKCKMKRCPKCRSGIRKVFGCRHMECRCGAHFCWECLLPIGTCDGSCEGESENEHSEPEPEEDDLDGRAGFYEGDGHNFGEEPRENAVDMWGCHHTWVLSKAVLGNEPLECYTCFKTTHPMTPGPKEKVDDADKTAWYCAGAHMTCPACHRPHEIRKDQPAASYTCWCGAVYCHLCDRNEKIKELEAAYECSTCGARVCGACKDNMER